MGYRPVYIYIYIYAVGILISEKTKSKFSTLKVCIVGTNDRGLKEAQWLSGRVLDSRQKGHGFEPHQRHCVVVLEQDTFILA